MSENATCVRDLLPCLGSARWRAMSRRRDDAAKATALAASAIVYELIIFSLVFEPGNPSIRTPTVPRI
jgi:hypothetical protein